MDMRNVQKEDEKESLLRKTIEHVLAIEEFPDMSMEECINYLESKGLKRKANKEEETSVGSNVLSSPISKKHKNEPESEPEPELELEPEHKEEIMSNNIDNDDDEEEEDQAEGEVEEELPREFQEKIEELNGDEVKLLIQKKLYETDLSRNHGRFSIPMKKIRDEAKNFLTEAEESSLKEREVRGKSNRLVGISILVLDPCLTHHQMCLKKWSMKTDVYNITSGLNKLVRHNHLQLNDVVQLWSFRISTKLCFALVKL